MGEGQNYTARWYYDTKDERCRQFYYGGYGGNENNFHDEDSCMLRCEKVKTVTESAAPQPPQRQPPQKPAGKPEREPEEPKQTDGQFRTESCYLESDGGECRVTETRFFYNKAEGLCDVFAYGGCGGNENNFRTNEECEQHCGNVQDACGLPPVYGRCQENSTRYYYDARSDECVTFAYSGCRGNKNNFYTEHECLGQCQRRQTDEHQTQAPPKIDDVSITFKYPRLKLSNY